MSNPLIEAFCRVREAAWVKAYDASDDSDDPYTPVPASKIPTGKPSSIDETANSNALLVSWGSKRFTLQFRSASAADAWAELQMGKSKREAVGSPVLVGKPKWHAAEESLEIEFTQAGTNWSDPKHPAGISYSPEFGDWGQIAWEEVRSKLSSGDRSTLLAQVRKVVDLDALAAKTRPAGKPTPKKAPKLSVWQSSSMNKGG